MNRRRFLKCAGATAVGIGAAALVGGLILNSSVKGPEITKATSTTIAVPQIDQGQIDSLVYAASQTASSIRTSANIINPYAFNENTLVGDLLISPTNPVDWFDFYQHNVYDNNIGLNENNPEKLKQSPSLVSALRLITQGLVADGVSKINKMNLNSISISFENNDVRKVLEGLNKTISSNDSSGIQKLSSLGEYQWIGLTREAYTSRNIFDIQSQIQDFFNGFYNTIPYGEKLSDFYYTSGQGDGPFYIIPYSLSPFTRYVNGRASVADWILNGSFGNVDSISGYSNSDPVIANWSKFFTPSALNGLEKLKQIPEFDSKILDSYLTQDPFFWSGQLDTRLSTISEDPKMF